MDIEGLPTHFENLAIDEDAEDLDGIDNSGKY